MGWLDDANLSMEENKQSEGNLGKVIKLDTSSMLDYSRSKDLPTSEKKTYADFIYEFTQELVTAGFELGGSVAKVTNDSPRRCDIAGSKPNTLPGWYYFKITNNAAFGTYGDWRMDSTITWKSYGSENPTATEIQLANDEWLKQSALLEEEKKALKKAAIQYVNNKIIGFKMLGAHQYMINKKIMPACVQTHCYQWMVGGEKLAVIPLFNAKGEVQNWQTIDETGSKRFKKHAVKKGNFHIFGDPNDGKNVIYCEGFATGASIYLAVGGCVVVCFDAYNIKPVMWATKDLVMGKNIFIGCDHDKKNDRGNRTGEFEAAKCVLDFPDTRLVVPKYQGQDFNSLHVKKGLPEVAEFFYNQGFEKLDDANTETVLWDGYRKGAVLPEQLKKLPSPKLEELAQWMLSTAIKKTDQSATIGAIVFACGLAGRRYKETEYGNYSSVMACFIAPTGGGKDFVKSCISKILNSSDDLAKIVGSSSYTSEAAIRNQLITHPTKLSVIDEFGDKLNRAMRGVGGREGEAFDAFKEIYSDCRGVWAGRAYARNVNDSNEDLRAVAIKNPSLTIIGLSTPAQFVEAITDGHVEGGFLNRLIIVDAQDDKVERQRYMNQDMPDWIVPHCEAVACQKSTGYGGNLSTFESDYSQDAKPMMIPISSEVSDVLWTFNTQIDEQFSEDAFMANISSRWAENAIRMAVGMSAFETPLKPTISVNMMNWCLSFTQYHGFRLAGLIDRYSFVSEYHRTKSMCLDDIRSTLSKGLSRNDMCSSKGFKGIDLKRRAAILLDLETDGLITGEVVKGAGRPSMIYYALKQVKPKKTRSETAKSGKTKK